MTQCGIDHSAGRLCHSAQAEDEHGYELVHGLSPLAPRAGRVLTTRLGAPHRLRLPRVRIPLQAGEQVAAVVVRESLQWAVRECALHGAQQRRQHLLDLPPRPLRVDDDPENALIPHKGF
jgi:hypothetical protein